MQQNNSINILREHIDVVDNAIFVNIRNYWFYLFEFRSSFKDVTSIKYLLNDDIFYTISHKINLFKDLLASILSLALNIKPASPGKILVDQKFFKHGLDNIKQSFLSLFLIRCLLSLEIGVYKNNFKLKIVDHKRWQKVKSLKIKQAQQYNIDTVLIDQFWEEVHRCSCHIQQNLNLYV